MSEDECDALLTSDRLAPARAALEKASTIPADAYTSPGVYAREQERLFAREWLCAGRVDQVPESGDYRALDLLGEKLMIVRGKDQEIRVLSRVCRHRAAELIQGSGNTRAFQCPYHAWTYRLNGELAGAPFMDRADAFDRKTCRLPEVRSEIWQGWIFVNFDDDAEPLGPRLEPLSKRLAGYDMAKMVAVETATFDSPFNWKVLVDNFMEAYHHIATHKKSLESIYPATRSYVPDNEGPYSILHMPAKSDASGEDPLEGLPQVENLSREERSQLIAAVVYPFHLFAPSPSSLTWYQVLPQSFDRFELRIFTCFPRETLEDPALRETVELAQSFTRTVHHEDIGACEAVWSGLASRYFDSGRLCPLEKSIWQFNQWWIERMGKATGSLRTA